MLSNIWPEWQIEKQLGKGSYGTVYQAVRRDNNVESYAAIKIISIPSDKSEVDSLRSEGLDIDGTRTYFKGIVDDFVSEIQLMETLKGVQNIVSVEDYKVVEKKDCIGWDIYIRMELLMPFNTYVCDKKLTEEEVIKLGCDICTALEICGKRNIIHRDIKPENIFVNDFGYFKLGDFGIARKMENMTGGLSQKGTFNYMAPEVANSNAYDSRVDTYSLGIVLYRLLNNNKLPFLVTDKQLLNPNERKQAVERRILGESLPTPCNASPEMADLILRACAYDPNMRFASATEMKQALISVANGTYHASTNNLEGTTSVRRADDNYDKTFSVRKSPAMFNQKSAPAVNAFCSTPKKKNKMPAVISTILVIVILGGIGVLFLKSNRDRQEEINKIIEEAQVLADANDYVGAIAKVEDAMDSYSNTDSLEKKLGEYQTALIDQKITSIIANADSLADDGDYNGAINLVEEGLLDHPNTPSLQKKITEYNLSLVKHIKTQTLTDAQSLADVGEYMSAMSMIKAAQEMYGEDKDYDKAYKTYHKAYSKAEAELCVIDGDYPRAIKLIKESQKINPNDVELTVYYNTYCDNYVTKILGVADAYVAEWKIDEAIAIVDEGLKVIPNSSMLIEKSDKLDSLKPVSITDLQSINTSYAWKWNDGVPKDPFGNNYSKANNYACFSFQGFDTNYAEYRVYKKYNTITGVIAPHMDSGEKHTGYVQIYKDDILCYTSETISRKSDAVTFSVDISDAEYVKIFVAGYHNLKNGGDYDLILSDVMLWPQQ